MKEPKKSISIIYVTYRKRLLEGFINTGSLMLLFFVILSFVKIGVIGGLIISGFLIRYIFIGIREAEVYTTTIIFDDEILTLEYYRKDKGPFIQSFRQNNLTMHRFEAQKGSMIGSHIRFEQKKGEKKYVQYAVGDWSTKLFKDIVEN